MSFTKGLSRPRRNGIDWHDVDRLYRSDRLEFSGVASFHEEILLPYQLKTIPKLPLPVGTVHLCHGENHEIHPTAKGSFFFIAPGVAMTASQIFFNEIELIQSGEYFVRFGVSLGKGRAAFFKGEKFSILRNGDIAIVGLVPFLIPNDWKVILKHLSVSTRIPSRQEVIYCIGFCDISEGGGAPTKTQFNIRRGVVKETHPAGRDSVVLPYPCFETNLNTVGSMSGGPIFNSQGICLGVVSSGMNPEDAEPYTFGASLFFSMRSEFSNTWPPDASNTNETLVSSPTVHVTDEHFLVLGDDGGIATHSVEYQVTPMRPVDGLEIEISIR